MGVIYGTLELPSRKENYELVEGDRTESADVCIIGSGAAGAVLAKELAERGKKIILLERGGYYEGKDMNQNDLDMMPLLWKNSGAQFDDNLQIVIAQGSCLGGSTIINDAVCFDFPQPIIKEWRNIGVNFTDEEIRTHTEKVNKILHVSEVKDWELNQNNQMLRDGAEAIGLHHHGKNRRNCVSCMQCGFCHLGCHYETKQDVLQTYIHRALNNSGSDVSVFCNCYVEKLIYQNGRVVGVEAKFRDKAENNIYDLRVQAKAVIISCGAIASSKILLANNIAKQTAGKGLCLHPAPFVIGDFEKQIKANQGIPMAYTVHDYGVMIKKEDRVVDPQYQGREFLIESIFLPLLQFSMGLPVDFIQHIQLMQRFNHYAMAGIMVRDNSNGTVSIAQSGRTSVSYQLKEDDVAAIVKGIELVSQMWFELGAKKIITSFSKKPIINSMDEIQQLIQDIKDHPENLRLGSAHPQSGNRIGMDASNSVVDSDCKVHGFSNLFVCDASVFPNAVGVNPQITVMTIASIIAERILKNWNEVIS